MSEVEVAALKRQLEELWADTRARHAALHDEIAALKTQLSGLATLHAEVAQLVRSLRLLRRSVRRLERRRKTDDTRWARWARWGSVALMVASRGAVLVLLGSHPEIAKVLMEVLKHVF